MAPAASSSLTAALQPMSYAGDGLAEKGSRRLEPVQTLDQRRTVEGSGKRSAILQLRQRLLPRTVLHKAPPQCLAARQQAVMRVRKRKQRKKREGRPAIDAAAATDPDPVVMLVVRLLAATAVTNDRILFTNRTSA